MTEEDRGNTSLAIRVVVSESLSNIPTGDLIRFSTAALTMTVTEISELFKDKPWYEDVKPLLEQTEPTSEELHEAIKESIADLILKAAEQDSLT